MSLGAAIFISILSTTNSVEPPRIDVASLPVILPTDPASTDSVPTAMSAAAPRTPPAIVKLPLPAATISAPVIDSAATIPPVQDIVVVARRGHAPGDPLERLNAKSFAVTQSVDDAVVAPLSRIYEHSLPTPIRDGLRNFLENLHEPVVFVNYLIQLKPGKAAETLARFAIDTTIGVAGVFDIAKRRPFNLPLRHNGFADSLGYYGVKPGPFLFLPLIGPTTLRDLAGGVIDRVLLPLAVGAPFNKPTVTIPVGVTSELDRRAQLDAEFQTVRTSDDPYATRRSFFLCQRQMAIDHLHGRSRRHAKRLSSSQRFEKSCPTPSKEKAMQFRQ